jgi:endonuclease/exonuclease/phosphatase family metal-dependent hydrolase
MRKFLLLFLFFSITIFSQDNVRIMTYNILNYPGTDTTTRNPYFREIISATEPDILVVQEMRSQAGMNGFLNNIMNSASSGYAAGIFIDGPDTDNGIFFKDSKFNFISNVPVKTALRDINEFKLAHSNTGDTIIIYSLHLKASSGSANEALRAAEVDSLRKATSSLHPEAYFLVAGDFNIYKSSEQAYQKLLNQDQSGYFVDYINITGTWNNSAYSNYHTQSTRTRSFGGGANGGLDDRFDMILFSQTVYDNGGITFIPGSYKVFGNDGYKFNDSINSYPNNSVSQEIADALHYASDHLPVYAEFIFPGPVPVELISFTAHLFSYDEIELKWITVTETNNLGFELERSFRKPNEKLQWEKIAFIPGYGSSTTYKEYNYIDKSGFRESNSNSKFYRLKQIDLSGTFAYSNIVEVNSTEPADFYLAQNYPNPFNPSTAIEYILKEEGEVKISIYDALGREVMILVNEFKEQGYHQAIFNGINLPGGIYFYTLSAVTGSGVFTKTKKLMLLK